MKKTVRAVSTMVLAASVVTLFACGEGDRKNGDNSTATEMHEDAHEAGNTAESNMEAAGAEARSEMHEAGEEMANAADRAQDDLRKEKEKFRAEVNRKIEKNQKDINDLKAKAKDKKADARKKYDEQIVVLENKNNKLRSRMNEFKDDSNDGWQKFKKEFNHDMDELGTAISNLFEDNK